MEKLSFHAGDFEGPLDLLLHLIAKHKMDIRDIQISDLLEQYLSAIQSMQEQDLEIASEFLEMASRLVYLKTVTLLPRHEEESAKLKQELQGQLLEYQVCKMVAMELGRQSKGFSRFVRAPAKLEAVDMTYTLQHSPYKIYYAYQDAIGRGRRKLPPPAQAFSGIVARRMVSVKSRIIYILKRLYQRGKDSYIGLFEESDGRGEIVATFLALLELIKAKRVTENGGQIIFLHQQRTEERT